jgi:hypothetical protein
MSTRPTRPPIDQLNEAWQASRRAAKSPHRKTDERSFFVMTILDMWPEVAAYIWELESELAARRAAVDNPENS